MAVLEKLISYEQAVLDPAEELALHENGAKVKLRPLDNLALLCHFDGDPGESGQKMFGSIKNSISGTPYFPAGFHALDYDLEKFGQSSLLHLGTWLIGITLGSPPPEIVAAPELTVDFWARFSTMDTSSAERNLIDRYKNADPVANAWQIFMTDGQMGLRLNTTSGIFVLQTSGLNLNVNTWYHLRFSWSETQHQANIFVDGLTVASDAFEGTVIDSSNLLLQSPLQLLYSDVRQDAWMDELRIFNCFKPGEFAPPGAATKPYSANLPKAQVSVDAGFPSATWFPQDLSFLDETDFLNQGIKIRINADDDNTPEFAGEPLTLTQVRSSWPLVGRWFHIEFSFVSDGDVQRVLHSGKIGIKPMSQVLSRRAPEALRRI